MHHGVCIYDMRVPLLRNVLRNAHHVVPTTLVYTMVHPITYSLLVVCNNTHYEWYEWRHYVIIINVLIITLITLIIT